MTTETIAGSPEQSFALSMRTRERILGIASPIVLLVVWEVAARLHFIDTRFFPAPSSVIAVMIEMLRSGELVTNTLVSLRRLALGTLIGGVPALILGIAMGLEPLGPRGVRSAGGRDLSDPEKRDPAAGAADLRPRRRLENLHGGDRRVLPGGDQRDHRRTRDQPHLSRRRPQLQSQPLEDVLDHRACPARSP